MSGDQEQQQQCRGCDIKDELNCFEEPGDDEQSIIDVFEFDDTIHDRWLCSAGTGSRRNSAESKIQDLDAWLHADIIEPEVSSCDYSLRKNIDSRTFTRIKRRSNNLNFEQVEASDSPETIPFSLTNVWKNQTISECPLEEQNAYKERRDNIPMMLRPKTNQVLAAFLSESPSSISSQTSMEAFMNMTRSKEGVNSVLSDINETDVNHFLMNISQPSLLYSSIISDGKGDDSSIHALGNDSFVDSQILTDSMMEASMFKEVQDTTMLAEFLKQSNDSIIFEDKTICKSLNSTYTNERTFDYNSLNDKINSDINETFTNCLSPLEDDMNRTKIITSQEDLLNSSQVNTTRYDALNYTKVISPDRDRSIKSKDILSTTCILNKENEIDLNHKLDSTLLLSEEQFDVTSQISNIPKIPILQKDGLAENCKNSLETTFNALPTLRAELLQEVQRSTANKFDATLDNSQLPDIETEFDITYDCLNTTEPLDKDEVLDATYVQVSPCKSPSTFESNKLKKDFEMIHDSIQTNTKLSNIVDIQNTNDAKKNSEFQNHLSDQNRFNTFRKDSKIGSRLSMISQENSANKKSTGISSQSVIPTTKNNENLYQHRFNTFSKKMSTMKNTICIDNNVIENNTENKFIKPVDKLPRKIQAPRQLSKLPQFFQKSNPNLGTNLKSVGKLTMESDIEFNKGSQPNISCDNTSRSMESIGSTASVHSAPDIDDTLSICSESSRASYIIKPKSFEKSVSTDEEDKKFGILNSKIKRHVLENNWVTDKNLPSPILKNSVRNYTESVDSRSTSPSDSAEFNAKTSSPLTISPASSDQAINKIESDDGGTEVIKENNQVTVNVQSKQIKVPSSVPNKISSTKLRQPTNWAGAPNKVANNAVSGIPRPASRIPALKFARPNLK